MMLYTISTKVGSAISLVESLVIISYMEFSNIIGGEPSYNLIYHHSNTITVGDNARIRGILQILENGVRKCGGGLVESSNTIGGELSNTVIVGDNA